MIWNLLRRKRSQERTGQDVGTVWMSSVLSHGEIGMKQGLRSRFFGHDWQPATFNIPLSPDEVRASMKRYGQGHALQRSEFAEASAVWDQRSFSKVGDLFTCGGGAYVVKDRLAEVLARFDLGAGGLIPYPIYQADLETPYPGEFFLLNFGCIKNTALPEQCGDARKFVVDKSSGLQIWKVNQLQPGAEVVLGPQALAGPDLWFEEAVHNRIFLSDALARALIEIGMDDVFRLHRCRVAGGAA